jgi:hypothetical protein
VIVDLCEFRHKTRLESPRAATSATTPRAGKRDTAAAAGSGQPRAGKRDTAIAATSGQPRAGAMRRTRVIEPAMRTTARKRSGG